MFAVSQIIGIGARLVCNKAAAVLIGPAGIGIIGLIDNILRLVRGVTNFGIASSSVREVALLDQQEDESSAASARLIKIVYIWGLFTGMLGLFVLLLFSKQISNVVFKTDSKYLWIMGLSLYFVFNTISSIRMAVLQAKKKVSLIVLYNILSSLISSVIAVLVYYFYGIDGIIPVIVLTAMANFLLSLYFTKTIAVSKVKIAVSQIFKEGLPMAKLGLLLSVSAVFGQVCFYIIRWFLIKYHSYEILGVYQVGNTFLVSYIGLVFAAMANDFYPRLCNYEDNEQQFNNLVNDQTEFALLVVVPAVLVLYVIAPYLVPILYSKAFLDVLLILKIGLIGVVLKAVVWPIGFIALIKGNKKLYLKQNLIGDSVNVISALVGFYYFGLLGLGIAMVVMFVISGIYTYVTVMKHYQFKYRKDTLYIMLTAILVCALVVLVFLVYDFKGFNIVLFIMAVFSMLYSFVKLRNRLLK